MKLSSSVRIAACATALLALILTAPGLAQTPAKLDPPVKATVTGKFVGNGKAAAIKFVTVAGREPFNDKQALTLYFAEKDPAAAKNPSMDAMFGGLGDALTLQVFYDGGIFGCEVSHSAHQKRGFSSIGEIKMTGFKVEGGNVSGRVSTGKELDAFGEKWDVDLTFSAPLPEKLRNAASTPAKPVTTKSSEPAKTAASVPSGPLIAASKLPLPKDATNVEWKTTVKHIHFATARPVGVVAKEFSAALKQQGWKGSSGNLVTAKNAILNHEQGAARLTTMIQPQGSGSAAKVFTEGLDWTDVKATPPAPSKTATSPKIEDIEAQAQKAIEDAFKTLPKGL